MTDTNPISFGSHAALEEVFGWWAGFEHHRGERAELRRCQTLEEVLLTEAYHKLRMKLAGAGFTPASEDQLAAVAGVLAHVDEHAPEQSRIAAQMGGGSSDQEAPVSGKRFRRLLRRDRREDLYLPLVRIIRLLGRRVHVSALAQDVYYWGRDVRRRWARHYYEHALAEV